MASLYRYLQGRWPKPPSPEVNPEWPNVQLWSVFTKTNYISLLSSEKYGKIWITGYQSIPADHKLVLTIFSLQQWQLEEKVADVRLCAQQNKPIKY